MSIIELMFEPAACWELFKTNWNSLFKKRTKIKVIKKVGVLGDTWYYIYYNGECVSACLNMSDVNIYIDKIKTNIDKGLPKKSIVKSIEF